MKNYAKLLSIAIAGLIVVGQISCAQSTKNSVEGTKKVEIVVSNDRATAVFAAGCFWCTVHVFEAVVGVDSAIAGYAGGTTKNPTYRQVGSETTGHAESVLVYYNPKVISYSELLDVFFLSQDPTTPDQQGPDRGSSYRSAILFETQEQENLAKASIDKYNKSGMFNKPIVTEVKKLDAFYRAEEYHQHYILNNPSDSYVQNVSLPRFELFKTKYKGRLKE